MLRTIEHHNGFALQKITTPQGKLINYQLIPESSIGDASKSQQFSTLTAARQAGGWPGHVKPANLTLPKAAYIQNQKGYRADNQRK